MKINTKLFFSSQSIDGVHHARTLLTVMNGDPTRLDRYFLAVRRYILPYHDKESVLQIFGILSSGPFLLVGEDRVDIVIIFVFGLITVSVR